MKESNRENLNNLTKELQEAYYKRDKLNNESQIKIEEFLDNPDAKIEDIDLLREEWENVNPIELKKKYDFVRHYVCYKIMTVSSQKFV
jgi:hypothetical protein